MKADKIIKNAKIFTSDKEHPMATALVVKDGKFVYVGDEAGLSEYEGEVTDLGGRFIMPGIIDSHVHVTMPVGFEYTDMGMRIEPNEMNIEEMLLGFTINGAKQLGIDAAKGSIEAGKDADFLVFDNDLLTAEHEGFSHNKSADVYFCGKKVN
jgi:predicted amidohydrolase YtcJ